MQTTLVRQASEAGPALSQISAVPSTRAAHAYGNEIRPRSATFKRGNRTNGDKGLIEALMGSKVFEDYERAFTEATGLPVALRPVESWQLPHHGKRNENEFCAIMASKSRSCASCLQTQEQLAQKATGEAYTITCGAGLCESMVP